MRVQGGDLDERIDRAAEQYGLTSAALCGGTRRRLVVAARRYVAWIMVRQRGGSPGAVARALGVSRSTVLRGVDKRPDGVDEIWGEEQGQRD